MNTNKIHILQSQSFAIRPFLTLQPDLLPYRRKCFFNFPIYLLAFFLSFDLIAQTPTTGENYVMGVELLQPVSSVDMNNLSTIPDAGKKVRINYYDDLGREKQSILYKAGTDNKDIVIHYEYDGFGRQTRDYLPAPTEQATGAYISDPTSAYTSYYGFAPYQTDVYFSEKTIESSALNRVLKQAAPGDDWAKGSGHEIEFSYYSNSATEVDLYWVDDSGNLRKGNYNNNSSFDHYPVKSLSRVITKDENGHMTHEYKDKQGRVVLTRSFVEVDTQAGRTDPPSPETEKVDTYYVYDIYGNLAYVVPPKAAAAAAEGTVASAIVSGLCYTYKYDKYNRMIERRLPGKGWEHMVYDRQNRLVATQDAEMAKTTFTFPSGMTGKAWAFTKYDKFGRVLYTGLYKTTQTRAQLQTLLDGYGNNSEAQSGSFSQNGITLYYTKNAAFPKDLSSSNSDLLTVNYYDKYITAMLSADGISIPATVEGHTIRDGASNTAESTKGLPVASHVRVLPNEGWEKTYTFYDERTRPVRTHKVNHRGGYTTVDTKLNFRGLPQYTKTYHKRELSDAEVYVEDLYTYDNQERMVRHSQKLSNSSLSEQLIALNEYDRLGQLKTKKVGGNQANASDRWQNIDYKYNIRGWLTDINSIGITLQGKDAVPPTDTDDLFAFRIQYDQLVNGAGAYAEGLYNGNISQTLWKTSTDNKLRGYVYNYDRLNRLTDATYYKQDTNPFAGNYNEHLAYDINGNITSLKRNGGYENQTLPDAMDILTYTYTSNTNLLVKVADDGQDNTGFVDSPANTSNDYTYDANGNMTSDKNKNITSISYSHLNLPLTITFGNGTSISYIYNAAGQKISKYVDSEALDNTVKHVEYLDGFQYTGGVLNFFPHAEGYVNVTSGTTGKRIYNYVYNYTDHLGNIRLSYTKDAVSNQLKIMEENHYYPFGLKHQKYTPGGSLGLKAIDEETARPSSMTSTPYAYKYNGQEWQEELGLNMYDMDMRQYDPAIARWVVMDPVIHHSMSPYNAFDNNPVFWADPSGADSIFDSLGTEVASVTNLSTGTTIGAGGKGDGNGNSGEDPPKGSWFWDKNNTMFRFDPAMESLEQFNALVDQGLIEGQYIGPSGQYEVTRGGEIIGKVSLHPGGSWTDYTSSNVSQWVYHPNNGDPSTTNAMSAAGWGVRVHQTPFSIGLSGEFAFGLGGGGELGYFFGTYDSGFYANVFGSYGFSSGLGIDYTNYTSQMGLGPVTTSNFSGDYTNFQGSLFGLGGAWGKTTPNPQGQYIQTSGGGFEPKMLFTKPRLSGGFSMQNGTTYMFK